MHADKKTVSYSNNQLTEVIAWIMITSAAVAGIIFASQQLFKLAFSVIVMEIFFFISVVLVRKKQFVASKFWLVISLSLGLFYYSHVLGASSHVFLVLFTLSGVSLTLFSYVERKSAYIIASIPVLTWLLLEVFSFKTYQFLNIQTWIHYVACFLVILVNVLYVSHHMKFNFDSTQNLYKKNELLKQVLENNRSTTKELKEAYDELLLSRQIQVEMANQVSFAKLVEGIAHEIKNPLHLIRARAELLYEKESFDQDDINRFSNSVINTVDRLNHLMKPMLRYSKKDEEMTMAVFSMVDILDDLMLLSEKKCETEGIVLKTEGNFDQEIFADSNYIYQALMNVLVNAIQFCSTGNVIVIKAEEPEYYISPKEGKIMGLKISVQDTGEGIPKDKLDFVFDPYVTTKKQVSNIGLGLSIVFRYITGNNGLVEVDSVLKEGTTVSITLPLHVKETKQVYS